VIETKNPIPQEKNPTPHGIFPSEKNPIHTFPAYLTPDPYGPGILSQQRFLKSAPRLLHFCSSAQLPEIKNGFFRKNMLFLQFHFFGQN
jgi:hypothetical protein